MKNIRPARKAEPGQKKPGPAADMEPGTEKMRQCTPEKGVRNIGRARKACRKTFFCSAGYWN